MIPLALVGLGFLLGLLGYTAILWIDSGHSKVINPRSLPTDLESMAASSFGVTMVSATLSLAAAIAPITQPEGASFLGFWWWLGLGAGAIPIITGVIDGVRLTYPLEMSKKSWLVVASYWLSGGSFLASTWFALPPH